MSMQVLEDSIHFITGSAGDANAGGGCTQTAWDASGSMSDFLNTTTGAPVADETSVAVTESSTQYRDEPLEKCIKVTKNGQFGSVVAGTIVYFSATAYGAERSEVLVVHADYLILDRIYTLNQADGVVKAGGAFDGIQSALDETVTAGNDGNYYQRLIYTNKNEESLGAEVDVDANAGSSYTRKAMVIVEGFETVPGDIAYDPADSDYTGTDFVTYDPTAAGQSLFVFGASEANHEFRNIEIANITNSDSYYMWDFRANSIRNIVLRNCKTSGTGRQVSTKQAAHTDLAHTVAGILILDCDFSNVGGSFTKLSHGILMAINSKFNVLYTDSSLVASFVAINCTMSRIQLQSYACLMNCVMLAPSTDQGAVYNEKDETTTIVLNCIINGDGSNPNLRYTKGAVLYSDYNCVYNGSTNYQFGWPVGPNDITSNPLFVDASGGDYRLKPTSPCLNTGKSTINSGFTSMGAWLRKSLLGVR